jgi:hypothetical protein
LHDIARDSFRNQQAMIALRPQLEAPEEHSDDMIPETMLLAGVSLAATYLAAGGQTDLICIPGAMLGAVVALLKATQEKRLWTDKGILLIGSSVIGTTAPSAAIHLFWPQWLEKLTWHIYFLAGFIFSLIGWMLLWPFILALDARRDRIAKAAVTALERRAGMNTDSRAGGGDQNGSA